MSHLYAVAPLPSHTLLLQLKLSISTAVGECGGETIQPMPPSLVSCLPPALKSSPFLLLLPPFLRLLLLLGRLKRRRSTPTAWPVRPASRRLQDEHRPRPATRGLFALLASRRVAPVGVRMEGGPSSRADAHHPEHVPYWEIPARSAVAGPERQPLRRRAAVVAAAVEVYGVTHWACTILQGDCTSLLST